MEYNFHTFLLLKPMNTMTNATKAQEIAVIIFDILPVAELR